jgi:hypothetical protein
MVPSGSYKGLKNRAPPIIEGTALVNTDRNRDTEADTPETGNDVRPLTPEARRALAEAEARRQQAANQPRPPEIGGRTGPEPTRFGDWETGGIASDF